MTFPNETMNILIYDTQTESILTIGSRGGHSVGVITTTRITHASPAGAYAHLADRDWEGNAPRGCHDAAYQLVHGDHRFKEIR